MSGEQVTRLLRDFGEGDREAFDRIVPLLYDDLRRMAGGQLRRCHPGRGAESMDLGTPRLARKPAV